MCSADKPRFLPGSKDGLHRAPRTSDRGLDGFLLDRLAPSDAMDDVRGMRLLFPTNNVGRLN